LERFSWQKNRSRAYGLAIVEAEDEAAVHNFGTNDPAVKANVGFKFEVYHIPQAILREKMIIT
jgi:hypothetical protein